MSRDAMQGALFIWVVVVLTTIAIAACDWKDADQWSTPNGHAIPITQEAYP